MQTAAGSPTVDESNGPLPAQAEAWVREALQIDEQAGPLRVSRLHGGWTSDMWLVRAGDGMEVVLRQMTRDPWRRHAAELLAREAAVQRMLADGPVPVPRPVRVDPDGAHAGAPSLLMTHLPGRLELHDAGAERLAALAGTLLAIHRHDPPPGQRPRPYYSWAYPERQQTPVWSASPRLWARAFEVLNEPEPNFNGVFMHRDFHLGNVLWQDGQVSGVVDWVETSWGPADLDVAHCQTNLAMLHGIGPARAFRTAYTARGGRLDKNRPATAFWQIMDIVGFLPTPDKVAGPWRDAGRPDITDVVASARLEQWLSAVLADRERLA